MAALVLAIGPAAVDRQCYASCADNCGAPQTDAGHGPSFVNPYACHEACKDACDDSRPVQERQLSAEPPTVPAPEPTVVPAVEALHPLVAGPQWWRRGGPFAGAAMRTDRGSPSGAVRMHLGYEIARPDWLLYRVSVETDFRKNAVVGLALEAATPWPRVFPIIPSVGAILGVPLKVAPQVESGVRLGVAIHWFGVFGTVNLFDFYFLRGGGRVEHYFMATVSL